MNTRGKSYTDVLPGWERAFAALIVVLLLLLAGFFAVHQANQTGFFNERFGTLEMLLLYVPILLSILNYVTQLITGRRHPARLFEAASALLLAVAVPGLLGLLVRGGDLQGRELGDGGDQGTCLLPAVCLLVRENAAAGPRFQTLFERSSPRILTACHDSFCGRCG